MQLFVGNLKVPCYNKIKHYYYYDILEALSRDLFQRRLLEKQQNLLDEEEQEEKDLERQGGKETQGS